MCHIHQLALDLNLNTPHTEDAAPAARTPAVAASPFLLTCPSPSWPLPAAPVRLSVLDISLRVSEGGGEGGEVGVPAPVLELLLRAEARYTLNPEPSTPHPALYTLNPTS